jgi:hypothetical protein
VGTLRLTRSIKRSSKWRNTKREVRFPMNRHHMRPVVHLGGLGCAVLWNFNCPMALEVAKLKPPLPLSFPSCCHLKFCYRSIAFYLLQHPDQWSDSCGRSFPGRGWEQFPMILYSRTKGMRSLFVMKWTVKWEMGCKGSKDARNHRELINRRTIGRGPRKICSWLYSPYLRFSFFADAMFWLNA